MAELIERVENLEERMDRMEASNEKLFNKMFKKIDAIGGKMSKMMKWIYRLLGIIIILLLIIAVKSPQTASQIISSTGAVVKAF